MADCKSVNTLQSVAMLNLRLRSPALWRSGGLYLLSVGLTVTDQRMTQILKMVGNPL